MAALGTENRTQRVGQASIFAGSNNEFGMSKSNMNLRRDYEDVNKSLSTIEHRISRAQKNREMAMKKNIAKSMERIKMKGEEA